jgi:hypothetical protein
MNWISSAACIIVQKHATASLLTIFFLGVCPFDVRWILIIDIDWHFKVVAFKVGLISIGTNEHDHGRGVRVPSTQILMDWTYIPLEVFYLGNHGPGWPSCWVWIGTSEDEVRPVVALVILGSRCVVSKKRGVE